MPHSIDLNQAVLQGKEEALNYIRGLLYYPETKNGEERAAHMGRMTPEQKFNYVLSAEISLSMKSNVVEIDTSAVRQLLIDENRDILSTLPDGSQEAIGPIAKASGRVTQIMEYIAAMERVGKTYEDTDKVFSRINSLKMILQDMLSDSVRIIRAGDGPLVLSDLPEMECTGDCKTAAP